MIDRSSLSRQAAHLAELGSAKLAEQKARSAVDELVLERSSWLQRDEKAKLSLRRLQHDMAAAAKMAVERERELAEEVRAARAHAELKALEAIHATALAQAGLLRPHLIASLVARDAVLVS